MEKTFKKICVIGLGYIGLPTAAILATRGYEVVGLEISQRLVDTVNQGKVPILEPDLSILVSGAVSSGNLRAVVDPEKADVFIIAVSTPLMENLKPDTSDIISSVKAIAPMLEKGNLIVLESTSPVGTTETIVRLAAQLRPDLDIPLDRDTPGDLSVVYCPERVLPGKILMEIVTNDRIIGGYYRTCNEKATELYSSFARGDIHMKDDRTVELTKLVENAFRDVNIAFANELSLICDRLRINVWQLIELANHHPRVNILQPGPGVGGHCISVDPWFIVDSEPNTTRLIRTAREVNNAKPAHVILQVKTAAERFKKPVIACFGLAYKANIDDLRESPAIEITRQLAHEKIGEILAVEPHIQDLPTALRNVGVMLTSHEEALQRADIVVLLVDHDFFKSVKRETLFQKIVIDTRGIWTE